MATYHTDKQRSVNKINQIPTHTLLIIETAAIIPSLLGDHVITWKYHQII